MGAVCWLMYSAYEAEAAGRSLVGPLEQETEAGAMGKAKSGIPDRWTDYLPLGRRIPGTRFIAFKVPLKKSFEWRLAPNERFSPLDLVNQVREQNEELGLIIDLTYTTRYYEPEELPDSLPHCKILTVGHEVPDNRTVHKFKSVVNQFLRENQHNDKLIGVHCTHGLNRTGYLVCRYLIDDEGMDPNMAIQLFNKCRGHSIERKNYIDALRKGPACWNHHAAVSGRGWINEGYCRPADHSGFQASYNPQNLQQLALQEQRHFPAGRGRGRQNSYGTSYAQNWNPVTCYNERQSAFGPLHPPVNDTSQPERRHRRNRNGSRSRTPNKWFDSPPQTHLKERERSVPVQNSHYPLQHGIYSADRQSSQNFY